MAEITNDAAPGVAAAPAVASLPETVDGRSISQRYRFYILLMLCMTYAINMADRGILNTLMPPIKKEFHLQDWQIGIIAGPVFALVYSFSSIPLSTIADRWKRNRLLAITVALFSSATCFCGTAGSYLQLAFGRFLTGSVEAATVPSANSMIADLYPPAKRTSAITTFTAGGSAGGILAGLIGGVVATHYGWRTAFLVAGIPGLLLAILIATTMREPKRVVSAKMAAQRGAVPFKDVLAHLWSQKTFRWLALGTSCVLFHNQGAGAFTSVFMVQTHHFTLQDLSLVRTFFGCFGVLSIVLVGKLMDRLVAKDLRFLMWAPSVVAISVVPFTLGLLLSSNGWAALAIGGVGDVIALLYVGPMVATTQAVTPNAMRARAVAMQVLIGTLLGQGLGPPFAGFVSTALKAQFGEYEALRWSLVIMLIPNLLACFCYFMASKHLLADARKAREMDGLA